MRCAAPMATPMWPSSRAARSAAWRCANCCSNAPDILLLDEPTNHLDAESVEWLEHTLREYKGCVILVTHDRYFLDNVTGWILELDRGKGIPHEGNYSSFLERAGKAPEAGRRARKQRASARIAREREWISQSPARASGEIEGAHHRL